MTREEAIEYFKMKVSAREAIGNDIGTDYEAYKIALTALRPVSREQVEEAWRGEWKHYLPPLGAGDVQCRCTRCGRSGPETYSAAALAVGGHRMLKHRSARGAALP